VSIVVSFIAEYICRNQCTYHSGRGKPRETIKKDLEINEFDKIYDRTLWLCLIYAVNPTYVAVYAEIKFMNCFLHLTTGTSPPRMNPLMLDFHLIR